MSIEGIDGQLNAVVRECGEINRSKGWEDLDRRPAEIHALIHSEISEALEQVREGKPDLYQIFVAYDREKVIITEDHPEWQSDRKPEGESVELMDACIRIMSYYDAKGWDFEKILRMKMAYNRTRPHLHGGKKL